ncbi:MAG: rhomboid family [Geobacteraceae bacterium]|nr:MAG: rhomboid family [Geobacteraceae bacterium]
MAWHTVSAVLYGMEREREHIGAREEGWREILPQPGDGKASGALSERRVHLWALVLEARYVPCRIEPGGTGWHLLVPAEYLDAARNELRLFEEENRNWPPPVPPARPLAENTLATLSVLILLASFHNLTQLDISLSGHPSIDWTDLGNAHAAKIMDGQWWRLVTALTLHADWLHLFSNLAIGGVFIVYLCRDLGSGLAWSLLLGSGILGNLANAWLQPLNHRSVGASTIVFGAVGILAALSLVRYRHHLQRRWPLPFAAALALLALLGTEGKQTDLGAHLFGFVFGIVLGLVAEYLVGRFGRPCRGINALLALAGAITVAAAWWAALMFGQ